MRVTNLGIHDRLLANLQQQSTQLERAAQQVSSGRRNALISDDPVAGAAILRVDTTLRSLDGFDRSITRVRTRLDAEEATVDQWGDLLSRAKELGMAQAGANANATSRSQTAIEVDGLLRQAISLGNLRVGSEYIFGGFETASPPFDPAGNFTGSADQRQAQVGDGITMETVHNGQQLLIDSGIVTTLTALRDSLQGNDVNGIQSVLSGLDAAIDANQSNLAEIGTRQRAVESAQVAVSASRASLQGERSAHADIPLEEAMAHFMALQTALQTGLLVTSQRLQLSLTNYLS